MSQKMLGSFGFCSRSSTQDVQPTAETTETVHQSQSDPKPADDLDDPSLRNFNLKLFMPVLSSHHPIEVSDSKVPVEHHSKERKTGQRKTYLRSIQPSLYGKHPWISVCTTRYKIFVPFSVVLSSWVL